MEFIAEKQALCETVHIGIGGHIIIYLFGIIPMEFTDINTARLHIPITPTVTSIIHGQVASNPYRLIMGIPSI
ncbi:MAG: hypothetical protein CSB21_03155 [Deltaproteobacteria bacterium]|nr:MAG: hypothetical protein CSB21_03155 [Deltaproteobacteria bacterium]